VLGLAVLSVATTLATAFGAAGLGQILGAMPTTRRRRPGDATSRQSTRAENRARGGPRPACLARGRRLQRPSGQDHVLPRGQDGRNPPGGGDCRRRLRRSAGLDREPRRGRGRKPGDAAVTAGRRPVDARSEDSPHDAPRTRAFASFRPQKRQVVRHRIGCHSGLCGARRDASLGGTKWLRRSRRR